MGSNFLKNVQQDLKLYLFFNVLIMMYRWAFVAVFASQLNTAAGADFLAAFWYGLRISLKTTGALVLVPFLFGTLPQLFKKNWPTGRLRYVWGGLMTFVLTFGFMARIPYYKIYNQSFNLMLMNGLKDDQKAILDTAVKEYQLLPRLAGVLVLCLVLVYLLRRLLKTPVWTPPARLVKPLVIAFVVIFPGFAVFSRFGGAFNSDDGVHWESAARTKSNLLNEAILDDVQALYRVKSTYQRSHELAVKPISLAELKENIKILGGNPEAKTLDESFTRKAAGKALPVHPRTVVLVLGENYALWPLLDKYQTLGLADQGRRLGREGAYTYHFLPNGNGTMTSLNGFMTGLPEVNLYPNYHSERPGDVYGLGMGAVMKALGYKTVFWYGGLSSWQELKNFALRDGYDEFHCADEMPEQGQSSWGVPDEALFAAVERYMAEDKGQTFHFILTTSNHPPFAYDVDAKGFPRAKAAANLPDSIPKDKETLNQLGHIWYADDVMGKFILKEAQAQPDAFFVVTGDHAERFSFATEVDLRELSGIPCIFYGAGVTKALLPESMTGSHLQLMPTLAELLLPAGGEYKSLLPPLQKSDWAFNHRLVIENGQMKEEKSLHNEAYLRIIKAARQVSVWRVIKGNRLEE